MTVLHDPNLAAKLAELHAKSNRQLDELRTFKSDESNPENEGHRKQFLSDKLVALDRDKAEFCYQLCRAKDARNIVEVGTSFGVSTLYLAAAVRDNVQKNSGVGCVVGTEYEPLKAAAARKLFAESGLSTFIDLREGDFRQTLRRIDTEVDFVLIDIWIPMARPGLELVFPYLKAGAIVVCDNTARLRSEYAEYFAFINDPANGFRTMTLPFDGGLEMSVRV